MDNKLIKNFSKHTTYLFLCIFCIYASIAVANTYLVFLRFQLMRGILNAESYASEIALVRETIKSYKGQHWTEFLAAWA